MNSSTRPSLLGKLIAFVVMAVVLVLGLVFSMALLVTALVVGLGALGYFWWKTRALRQAMKAHVASASASTSPDGQVFEGEAVVIEEGQRRPQQPGQSEFLTPENGRSNRQ